MKITNQVSAKRRRKTKGRPKTSAVRRSPVKKSSKKKSPNAGKIAGAVLGGLFGGAALAFGGAKLIAKVKKDQGNNPASDQTSGTRKKCNKSFKFGNQPANAAQKEEIENRHKDSLAAQSAINIAENSDHFSAKVYKNGEYYLGYKPKDGNESFYQITKDNVQELLKSIKCSDPTLEGVKNIKNLTDDQEQEISQFLNSDQINAVALDQKSEEPELTVNLNYEK